MKAKCGCHPFISWEILIVPSHYQLSTQYLAFKPSLSFMQFLVIFLNCMWFRSLNSFLLPTGVCLYFSLYHGTHRKWCIFWCKWMRLLVQRDMPGSFSCILSHPRAELFMECETVTDLVLSVPSGALLSRRRFKVKIS